MFNCVACKAKDEEIKHLRAIVDSVLISKGLGPVASDKEALALEPIEVPQKIADDKDDIVQYGGDAQ